MKSKLLYYLVLVFCMQALFSSTVNAQCCKMPDSLKVKSITDSSFCLQWNANDTSRCDTAKAWQIRYKRPSSTVWKNFKGSYNGAKTHTFCDTVKSCTEYKWQVRNICIHSGDSTFSDWVPGSNFTIKCDTAHKALSEKLHALKVTPNPTTGLIVVSGLFEGKVHITVSSMIGKKIYETTIVTQGKLSIPLNLSEFENGFYFVTVSDGKEILKANFLKN